MMILTADFHTHILPGIDDGSKSLSDSVEMIHKEQEDGVSTIFLTPHFYPQQMYPASFLENRRVAFAQLCDSLSKEQNVPELILGAEVQYCPGMSQWDQLDKLTIGASKYILIEMPFAKWGDSVYSDLKHICFDRGLTPIIAHVERYFTRWNMRRLLKRLSEFPVLLQMNCEFLADKKTRRIGLKLLSEHKVHLFGSDCHSPTWRPPIMEQCRQIIMANSDPKTITFLKDYESLIIQNSII